MYVFSVNGFPTVILELGVKTAVYERVGTYKRMEYTKAIADLLVGSGPQTSAPSRWVMLKPSKTDRVDLAINTYSKPARTCISHQNTGIFVQLCLEPEPATFLETTDDVLSFFVGHGFTGPNPINQHLAVCYDTCHQAVMFESAEGALQALHEAGVRIGKMQISNAIVLDDPQNETQRAVLMQFDEARFLHQVVADDGELFALDLPELRAPSTEWLSAQEWRCHFHVPLHWTGSNGLSKPIPDWKAALQYALDHQLCTHFEIETYTWGVLPNGAGETRDVSQGICAEFRVVMPSSHDLPREAMELVTHMHSNRYEHLVCDFSLTRITDTRHEPGGDGKSGHRSDRGWFPIISRSWEWRDPGLGRRSGPKSR